MASSGSHNSTNRLFHLQRQKNQEPSNNVKPADMAETKLESKAKYDKMLDSVVKKNRMSSMNEWMPLPLERLVSQIIPLNKRSFERKETFESHSTNFLEASNSTQFRRRFLSRLQYNRHTFIRITMLSDAFG